MSCSSTGGTRRRWCRWRSSRTCAGGWTSAREQAWGGCGGSPSSGPSWSTWVLDEVREGPADGRRDRGGCAAAGQENWGWNWSDTKRALEWLFWTGEVTAARRNGSFARVYDLPSGSCRAAVLNDADARARPRPCGSWSASPAAALGVAAEVELRDYFRLPSPVPGRRSPSWSRTGELRPVDGRRAGARGPTCTPRPSSRGGSGRPTLISPFDPLIWERNRTERLFGFRYRIEIYTPTGAAGAWLLRRCRSCSATRWWPGSTSRPTGRPACCGCRAPGSSPDRDAGEVAEALAGALAELAGWLGLGDVAAPERGDLARPLAAALRSAAARYRMSVSAAMEHTHPHEEFAATGVRPIAADRSTYTPAAQPVHPVPHADLRARAAVGRAGRDRDLLRRCRVLRAVSNPTDAGAGDIPDLPGQADHRAGLPRLRWHPGVLLPDAGQRARGRPAPRDRGVRGAVPGLALSRLVGQVRLRARRFRRPRIGPEDDQPCSWPRGRSSWSSATCPFAPFTRCTCESADRSRAAYAAAEWVRNTLMSPLIVRTCRVSWDAGLLRRRRWLVGWAVMARSLLVEPDTVLRSSQTRVPVGTPTQTSPEAELIRDLVAVRGADRDVARGAAWPAPRRPPSSIGRRRWRTSTTASTRHERRRDVAGAGLDPQRAAHALGPHVTAAGLHGEVSSGLIHVCVARSRLDARVGEATLDMDVGRADVGLQLAVGWKADVDANPPAAAKTAAAGSGRLDAQPAAGELDPGVLGRQPRGIAVVVRAHADDDDGVTRGSAALTRTLPPPMRTCAAMGRHRGIAAAVPRLSTWSTPAWCDRASRSVCAVGCCG